MKKVIIVLTCLILLSLVNGQDPIIFDENLTSPAERHNILLFNFGGLLQAGIGFAKDQGIEPYDYGKYLGEAIAPSWQSTGFRQFTSGLRYFLDCYREDHDGTIDTKELVNGSIEMKVPYQAMIRICTQEKYPLVTQEETLTCIQAFLEELADINDSKISQELSDSFLVFVVSKK